MTHEQVRLINLLADALLNFLGTLFKLSLAVLNILE